MRCLACSNSSEKSTSSLFKALQGEDRELVKGKARALNFAKRGGFLVNDSMQHTLQRCRDVVHYGISPETSAKSPYGFFEHYCTELPVNILTCQQGGRQSTEALKLMNVDFSVSSSPGAGDLRRPVPVGTGAGDLKHITLV